MNDDLLERAAHALREDSSRPDSRAGLTRARLLASANKRAQSSLRHWVRTIVAALSLFVVGTALARVSGYWPAIRAAILPAAPTSQASGRSATTQRPRSQPTASAANGGKTNQSAVAQDVGTETARQERPDDDGQATGLAPEPARRSKVAANAGGAPNRGRRSEKMADPPLVEPARSGSATLDSGDATPTERAAPDANARELALFRRAQTLHLARDPAALAAWDAYLALAEHGALVPEARYNRALCLVRLGRKSEARLALEPFAHGDYAAYRRNEAQALLDALGP
jgi:hypothetical protein